MNECLHLRYFPLGSQWEEFTMMSSCAVEKHRRSFVTVSTVYYSIKLYILLEYK